LAGGTQPNTSPEAPVRKIGYPRSEERIRHRQLLVKDLTVLQVLAVENVTPSEQR
jgi:hypothetical protein